MTLSFIDLSYIKRRAVFDCLYQVSSDHVVFSCVHGMFADGKDAVTLP